MPSETIAECVCRLDDERKKLREENADLRRRLDAIRTQGQLFHYAGQPIVMVPYATWKLTEV